MLSTTLKGILRTSLIPAAFVLAVGSAIAQPISDAVKVWGMHSTGVGASSTSPVAKVASSLYHNIALRKDGTLFAWGSNPYGESNVPVGYSDFTAIAAGGRHTLAVRRDGSVIAWGSDVYGECDVPLGSKDVATQVSAGFSHSLALLSTGEVVAWGSDLYGEGEVPSSVTNAKAIASGYNHNLALLSSGRVVGWGANSFGQCSTPTGVVAKAIAAGGMHSLAVRTTGTVVAWGYNDKGQTTVPSGLTGVTQVAGGLRHSLALKSDGTVVAWGDNSYGQTSVPDGLTGVIAISAGQNHSVAVKSDGTVVSWGDNTFGQTDVPIAVSAATQMALGYAHTVILKLDGTVAAWGDNTSGQTSVPAGLTGVTQVSAGTAHSMALKSDGTVVAWGDNSLDQTSVPGDLSGATQISAGGTFSLALKSDGTVVAWGDNTSGQTAVPNDLTGVTQVSAGNKHALALKSDGSVVAWGDSTYGQATVPAAASSGVIQVVAGYQHSLALKADGTVVAWGDNRQGQTTVPSSLTGVVALAAGYNHSVALKSDGTVIAWGDDTYGQTDIPISVVSPTQIVAGGYRSGAVSSVTVTVDGAGTFGGLSTTGTVTLAVAPTTAVVISLSSSDATVSVPSSVTINAGEHSATFPINVDANGISQGVLIRADYNGAYGYATLTTISTVKKLVLNPTAILGGSANSVTGTVTLSGPAPEDGLVVALSADDPTTVSVPATVTVLGGSSTASFQITTQAVATTKDVVITAVLGPTPVTAALTVLQPATKITLTFDKTRVASKGTVTGTITLDGGAPDAGLVASLVSNHTYALTVPDSVNIPASATQVTFTGTSKIVNSATTVKVTATVGDWTPSTASVAVLPPAVTSLVLDKPTVVGGVATTATLTIDQIAPEGGITVTISSSNPLAATVPATVTVPKDANTVTIPITTLATTKTLYTAIRANTSGNTAQSAKLAVIPPLRVLSLVATPMSVVGGNSITATVTISGPAGADYTDGFVVDMASTQPSFLPVPSTVTVANGQTSITFLINTVKVYSDKAGRISATHAGSAKPSVLIKVTKQ